MRTTVSTDMAPAPVGAYSQSARIGPILSVAGQVGIDPATNTIADGVAAQTDHALRSIQAILEANDATLDQIIRMDCYLPDPDDVVAFNEAYGAWFPQHGPARTTVFANLAAGLRIEITALAVVGS